MAETRGHNMEALSDIFLMLDFKDKFSFFFFFLRISVIFSTFLCFFLLLLSFYFFPLSSPHPAPPFLPSFFLRRAVTCVYGDTLTHNTSNSEKPLSYVSCAPLYKNMLLAPVCWSSALWKDVFFPGVFQRPRQFCLSLVHSFCHLRPTRRSCLKQWFTSCKDTCKVAFFPPPGYNIMVVNYRKFSKYHKHTGKNHSPP